MLAIWTYHFLETEFSFKIDFVRWGMGVWRGMGNTVWRGMGISILKGMGGYLSFKLKQKVNFKLFKL